MYLEHVPSYLHPEPAPSEPICLWVSSFSSFFKPMKFSAAYIQLDVQPSTRSWFTSRGHMFTMPLTVTINCQ